MVVSPLGKVMDTRERQLLKAEFLITFSVDGRVADVMYLHLTKENFPTEVIPSFKTTD